MPENSIRERGRQTKGGSLELARATAGFLDSTKQEIAYRWLYRGQSTREISRWMRINDRDAVEKAVRDVVAPSGGPGPFVVRRAA